MGFFEAGGFHPDFILWLVAGGKQSVTFKGVRLESFIVSNTKSATMRKQWDMEKSAMLDLHVLFQEEDRESYVRSMLEQSE